MHFVKLLNLCIRVKLKYLDFEDLDIRKILLRF